MSMSFGLGVGINQSQKLTPQMQQAIRLLAMSQMELEQEVQLKLDSNPLLERVEEDFHEEREELSLDDWADNTWEKRDKQSSHDEFEEFGQDELSDSFDKLAQSELDGSATDSDWTEVYVADPSDLDFSGHSTEGEHEYLGETKSTIQDHVRWQMNFKKLSERESLIADYLIDAMDDRGYIRLSLDELYQNLALEASFYQWQEEISPAHITAVLQSIQACSPTGVGARSLAECLRLQLDELTAEGGLPFADEAYMVLSAIHHLENNNIKGLMQETDLDMYEIKGAIALIKTLNPEPAIAFYREQSHGESSVDVPDVLVLAINRPKNNVKKSGKSNTEVSAWQVMLNPDVLPHLQINKEYVSLIKKGDDSPHNVYLKEQLADARLFIRSIDERNQNLLKVATCIIHRQQAFCESGVHALLPLTLKDIATEVGLHESTVSRLTTNKNILTPQGLYPLKYFFSSGIESDEGDVSSTAVCAKIREIISSENPKKPFSDAHITTMLESQGMNISRRTVTKYRENMGILSSTLRRQKM